MTSTSESARRAAETRSAPRRQEVIEEVRWLLDYGTDHADNIARRLGYSHLGSLRESLKRWGRIDLSDRLAGKDRQSMSTSEFPAPPAWSGRAACASADNPDLWFPSERRVGKKEAARIKAAKQICAGCPVWVDCLKFALAIEDKHGIFGGLTAHERQRLMEGAA